MIQLAFFSPGAAPSSRFIPWQFSLRSLLLLMFLVGVGLVVYRWPWKVDTGSRDFTTYRRGWHGKPLKHGPEEVAAGSELYLRWYVDNELRLARQWKFDEVVSEQRMLAGKKHGFCWEQDDKGVRTLGTYRHGLKHGGWERISREGSIREQWVDDKLHGRRIWLSPRGKELQSAEYEKGRLVKWNGQPLKEELRRWLATTARNDPRLLRLLFEPVEGPAELAGSAGHYGELTFRTGEKKESLMVHWEAFNPWVWRGPRWRDPAWQDRFLGESLLEYSLEHSFRWDYRYGLLTMVPINEKSLGWQDRTGVFDVKFETGSSQEAYWVEPAMTGSLREKYLPARLREVFPPLSQRPIELDLSPIDYKDAPIIGGGPSARHVLARPRRDLLGQHLDRENCYCVEEGNKLIIKQYVK
jgi:hypothetical protein